MKVSEAAVLTELLIIEPPLFRILRQTPREPDIQMVQNVDGQEEIVF